jgi:hypothetical protein
MNQSLYILFILLYFSSQCHTQKEIKTHIFGHSLINHVSPITPPELTTTPYWINQFANAAGHQYAISGQWGQLMQHRELNVQPNWGIAGVPGAWDGNVQTFSDVDFSAVIIMPSNFEQYLPPDVNYEGGFDYSPIDATIDVFDWCLAEEPDLHFYIYEHWPEMSGFIAGTFPPTSQEWITYNDFLAGDYNQWFIEYHDALTLQYPNSCISMIPVGPIISKLLLMAPYDQIEINDLYEDPDPHGRPSIYFLAGMVTYMAMYEEQTPASYQVPTSDILPVIANNYSSIRDFIWTELQGFNYPTGNSRTFCSPITTTTVDITVDNSGILFHPNPCDDILLIEGEMSGYDISIIDNAGQVYETINNSSNQSSFDVSGLPNGIYFIRIRSQSNDKIWVESLIKI